MTSWKQKHSNLRERVYKASGANSIEAFDKQVTRAAKGLTSEEALFILAEKYNVGTTRDFNKLLPDSQSRVSNTIQNVRSTEINTTKSVKIDKRVFNVNDSVIHNLSIGDRSTVTQSVVTLSKELDDLFREIDSSKKLSQVEKSDYKSDVEALATQIGKRDPNKNIVRAAWKSIEGVSTIDGFINLIARVAPLVITLLNSHY